MALSSNTGNLKVKGAITANGFKHSDSTTGNNNYVLLAGGGTKAVNTFQPAGNYVTIDTEQIITGKKTFNAPTDVSGSEVITTKFKTSNGGSISFGKQGPNSGTMIRLDQADGTCRLRFRASTTAGAMVWEQPENGAKLYVDLGGTDKHRITFPDVEGTLSVTSHTHSYTPAGTVSKPTFTGSAATSGGPSATTTVANSSHTHTLEASGAITISTGTGTANYTPAGTVTGSFKGSAVNSGAPSAKTTVAHKDHTHTLTATGSITIGTGTGTANYTPAGTVSKPTFTGSAATSGAPSAKATVASSDHTHSVTATGSVKVTDTYNATTKNLTLS